MNKATRPMLVLALASMVIVAGCQKQEEAVDTTVTTATTEAAAVTTETTAVTETTATTATTVAATTGVPECDAYLAAVDKYMACEKVPQAARDAQKQATDQMRSGWASWSSLPEDSRKMAQANAATACATGLSSLKVAASASGCPIE
jgi:hypothetical protein